MTIEDLMLPDRRGASPSVADRSPLRACFGVACACRGRCARYAAVDDSQASPDTLLTCVRGATLPLFVESLVLRPQGRATQRA